MFNGLRKKLKRMGIATRLAISFVVVIVLLLVVAFQSNIAVRHANRLHRVHVDYILAQRESVYRIQGEFFEFRFLARNSFMSQSWRDTSDRTAQRSNARWLTDKHGDLIALADEYKERAQNDPFISGERRETVIYYMEQVCDYFDRIYAQFLNYFFIGSAGTYELGNIAHYKERVDYILRILIDITQLSVDEALLEAESITRNSLALSIVLVVVAVTMAIVLGYRLITMFTQRVRDAEKYVRMLQESGLKTKIADKNNDEFSRIVTDMEDIMLDAMKDRDIASRKRAEAMFDATPAIIEFWNTNGECIDCNLAALKHHGAETKDALLENYGKFVYNSSDAMGKNPWEGWRAAINEAFVNGTSRYECVKHEQNGEKIYYDCFAQSVVIEGDDPTVISYIRDITPQKEVELAQRQFFLAQKNSLAKSDFLARMSHEIRTPLTAVLGISEIQLQNPSVSIAIEEAFAKIYNSASILLSLINDILDLSRIESGKLNIITGPYEVASMVIDVVQMHLIYLGSKRIEFRVDTDENLPAVLVGDELRIRQVLNNLLSNAFKYTESGEIEFSLRRIRNDHPNKITLKIRIRDTGLGMTHDQLNRLMEEYTRFHEKEHSLVEGTGLGMSIVYSLVNLMGGTIEIDSAVGEGTSVIIHLPQEFTDDQPIGAEVAENLMSVDNLSASMAKRAKFVPEAMPYGRVLIVDDIDTNLYVARGLLTFYDLHVDTCTSGKEAIALISAGNNYDVVFMDQMMPDMTGTATVRHLRKAGYTQPIIALTANALIGQAEIFVQNGFDGFLSKPIQTTYLNDVLNKYVRDKQPQEVIEAARAGAKQLSGEGINDFLNREMNRLRKDFYNGQKNTAKNIRGALENSDFETAHRLVHTLKGLAGLIKESELTKRAYIVEKTVRQSVMPEDELIVLEAKLEQVLSDIEASMEVETSEQNLLCEGHSALFDKLQIMLAENDAACIELIAQLRNVPEAKVLVKLIEDYSFETARQTLETMRAVLEI